jgi:plastocyanin
MVKKESDEERPSARGISGLVLGCVTILIALVVSLETGNGQKAIEVKMIASATGNVYFDPIGIHIEPGDTVRWVQINGYHSTTAYHPENDNHELRIPEHAAPWNSDIMIGQYPAPGSVFEQKFTVEGVYDYFCRPHEQAGMVGRIIVGRPLDGPGTRAFNYAPEKSWKPVPIAAQRQFPSVEEIMAKGIVRSPGLD